MNRKLIVNADGFGFTNGINKGIIESIEKGIVSSISCNVNFPYIQEILYIVKNHPNVSIGLHLNINVGKPVCKSDEVPTLVNEYGEFWGNMLNNKLLLGHISLFELQKELEAQILKLQNFGINISHLDGHQHKHLLPGYFGVALKLGKKYNINRLRCHRKYLIFRNDKNRKLKIILYYLSNPRQIITHIYARILMNKAEQQGFVMPDRLIAPAYFKNTNFPLCTWINILKSMPSGINEIYCHPGYPDNELRNNAKYTDGRLSELAVLTSPELFKHIKKESVQVISFNF